MTRAETAIIISDGGLAALVAAAIESRRGTGKASQTCGVLWPDHAMDAQPGAGERRRAVASQATLLNLELAAGPSAPTPPSGIAHTALLMDAGREAVRRGISRVVWPVQAFPDGRTDLPALARICDRALLVGQLLSLDAPADWPVRIETPLADLTDAQILELALDLDAPLSACWRSDNDLPIPRPGSAAGENPMHVYTRPRPAAAVGGGSAAR